MILFEVDDEQGQSLYFDDYDVAIKAFNSAIQNIEFPNDNDVVCLYRVNIPITAQTVLKLLNGDGGYRTTCRLLKNWKRPST